MPRRPTSSPVRPRILVSIRLSQESAADSEIAKPEARQTRAIERVAAVQHNAGSHARSQRLPIHLAVLLPLGYQHQRVSVVGRFLGRFAANHLQIAMLLLKTLHR